MLNVSIVDVWRSHVEDRVGGLADKLRVLAQAGADLEFIMARRSPVNPGGATVFVSPLVGEAQQNAALRMGFEPAKMFQTVRVEGPDQAGTAYLITEAVASVKVNMRGFSACRLGPRFIAYLSFENADDAERVAKKLNLT